MNVILYNPPTHIQLWPLSRTRPVAEIRVGIFTLREKWEKRLKTNVSHHCDDPLQHKWKVNTSDQNILIDGSVIANENLEQLITCIKINESIFHGDQWLASCIQQNEINTFNPTKIDGHNIISIDPVKLLKHPWQIFQWNDEELRNDFSLISGSNYVDQHKANNSIIGDSIFIEENVSILSASINTNTGPVYIAKGAEIMEGAMIRGPFYLGENAQVKMGAKIYGATSIGPGCRVGGELNNVLIQANSNKAHDGFLGNAVIGEWCNIGADSNASNLKNNYEKVKVWSYTDNKFINSESLFCGLIMGDHAKCGINTMFNTGTVVGIGANVFGDGFPRQFIPDYAWGGAAGFSTFKFDKFIETAKTVMSRRNQSLSKEEENILLHIYQQTAQYRTWEKL